MRDNFGSILFAFMSIICIVLWATIGLKAFLLTFSLFCLLMWFNITFTTLGNAFIGRDIDVNYDIFWKLLFIILASAGFGVYFNI